MLTGLSFPLTLEQGRFKSVSGIDVLKRNVGHIISTFKNERLMEPDMGSDSFKAILRALGNDSGQSIAALVQQACNEQEPRALSSVTLLKDNITGIYYFHVKLISKQTKEAALFDVEVSDGF